MRGSNVFLDPGHSLILPQRKVGQRLEESPLGRSWLTKGSLKGGQASRFPGSLEQICWQPSS